MKFISTCPRHTQPRSELHDLPTDQQRQENTRKLAAYARSLKSTSPAEQPIINSNLRESSKAISVSAATIARNITQAVFANAQANQKTPEEILLDELHSRHRPDELYPIWRVAALVRAGGFEVFALGEDGNEIKQRLGMTTLSPAAAYRPCKAIVLDSIEICTLAVNTCRVRPHAAMTAVILHELGHLLDTAPGTDAQREIQAWVTARKLLEIHQFWGVCQDWEFERIRERCLQSYGIHA